MSFQPNRNQWHALDMLAIALRPDWANNKPGPTWTAKISDNTLPHAESFEHCVNALLVYATTEGTRRKRTPDIYPEDGAHWESTRPKVAHENPRVPCPDHPLDRANKWSCIGCRSEIIAGDRPADMQGKHYQPREDAA